MIAQRKWYNNVALVLLVGLMVLFLYSFNSHKPPSVVSPPVQNGTALPSHDDGIQLKLQIEGLKSELGVLRVAIYNSPEHFLKLEHALFKQSYAANISQLEITLPETTEFALSIYQDSNNDGQLNKHFLGFPTEKYGFSNNPPIQFGAPTYKQSCISTREIDRSKIHHLQVTMK